MMMPPVGVAVSRVANARIQGGGDGCTIYDLYHRVAVATRFVAACGVADAPVGPFIDMVEISAG